MSKLQVGDTIKCSDKDDLLDYMIKLTQNGVYTDFMYEKDGEKGYWLIVERVEE